MNRKAMAAGICALLVAFTQYSGNIISPIIASLLEDFPQYSADIVTLVMTIPNIGFIFGPLIFSSLAKRIPVRTLGFIGLGLALVFGTIPLFLGTHFLAILACRVVYGFGVGLTFVIPKVILNANYPDVEGARWIGYTEVAASAGMMLFQGVSGLLATKDWHLSMLLHLVLLISIVALICLPSRNDPGSKHYTPLPGAVDVNASNVTDDGRRLSLLERFPPIVWFYWFASFGWIMGAYIMMSKLSLFIAETGLGTAADTGLALTVNALAGVIGGMFFGFFFKRFRDWVLPLSLVFASTGMLVLYNAHSMATVLLAVFLPGFGAPMYYSCLFQFIGRRAAPSASSMATSICSSITFLTQVIAPFAGTALVGLLGLESAGIRSVFLVAAGEYGLTMVIALIVTTIYLKRRRERA